MGYPVFDKEAVTSAVAEELRVNSAGTREEFWAGIGVRLSCSGSAAKQRAKKAGIDTNAAVVHLEKYGRSKQWLALQEEVKKP